MQSARYRLMMMMMIYSYQQRVIQKDNDELQLLPGGDDRLAYGTLTQPATSQIVECECDGQVSLAASSL
jgi:hypothetical protein